MAEPFTTSPTAGSARCRSGRLHGAALRGADQRLRILQWLTMGLTVAHVARAEPPTARRAPQIIAEMLARRKIDPAAGFAQFQIARLSEAMIDGRALMEGNLQPVDRSIRLTSELNRDHGFAHAQFPCARHAAAQPRPSGRLAANGLAPKWRRNGLKILNPRPEMVAPRKPRTHKMWNTGMRADFVRLRLTSRNNNEAAIQVGKFSASQSLEIDKNRERIRSCAVRIGT